MMKKNGDRLISFTQFRNLTELSGTARVNWPPYDLGCPMAFIFVIGIIQYGYHLVDDILSKVVSPDER